MDAPMNLANASVASQRHVPAERYRAARRRSKLAAHVATNKMPGGHASTRSRRLAKMNFFPTAFRISTRSFNPRVRRDHRKKRQASRMPDAAQNTSQGSRDGVETTAIHLQHTDLLQKLYRTSDGVPTLRFWANFCNGSTPPCLTPRVFPPSVPAQEPVSRVSPRTWAVERGYEFAPHAGTDV